MKCPTCGSEAHRVMGSKERDQDIRRRRSCDNCGKVFVTIEAPEPLYDRAAAIVTNFRQLSQAVGEE